MRIAISKRISCILLCMLVLLTDCRLDVLAADGQEDNVEMGTEAGQEEEKKEEEKEFGWKDTENHRYYIDEKTGEPHTGWLLTDGLWYYFNTVGIMQTGWRFINGAWYYLMNDGHMASEWLYDGGVWYYLGEEHDGAMKTGWAKVEDTWYYFNTSGAMQTGWLYQGGTWYYLGLPGDGAMKTGWYVVNGAWYFSDSSGAMLTGWLYDDGHWYYLTSSGAMVTRYISIDGKCYLFDRSGAMWEGGIYNENGCITMINSDGSVEYSYTYGFPVVYQKPELPTGCEITALTMLLNFYGYPASKITMASDYLPKVISNYYGVDLDYYFCGNPFGGGTVCGAGALVTAANGYLSDYGSYMRGRDITGYSVNDVYAYVSNGKPVVVMATIGMANRRTPQGWYTASGKYVDWSTNDHGLVLIGWDATTVTLACPLYGIQTYNKAQFEKVFASRGNRAMILE